MNTGKQIQQPIRKVLEKLVRYMTYAESHHYSECTPAERRDHIYKDVLTLKRWLKLLPKKNAVILTMTEEDWDTLAETISSDIDSSFIDEDIKAELSKAFDTVRDITTI